MNAITAALRDMAMSAGLIKVKDLHLEMINQPPEKRPNRMCISVSDIHLTDGTVGFQNLSDRTWKAFYQSIAQRCKDYHIEELVLVLDGDIVDMIRSGHWAANNIYPWERDREKEYAKVVNKIIKEIVEVQHAYFFKDWLQNLEKKLKAETGSKIKTVKTVVLIGNHDKELFTDQRALKYFYEKGLGIKLNKISAEERAELGRMYGDAELFSDPKTAPYLPFYYGDTGFRFFTTHGQWRDKENSAHIKAKKGLPGWSAGDGWQIDTWQKLRFSPFIDPCFGDSVAAGVLSTFIYKTKIDFDNVKKGLTDAKEKQTYHRLDCILDELDLYRPTYAAIKRILDEVDKLRKGNEGKEAIEIIETNLYQCIIDWLSWDFTYQSSPCYRRLLFKVAKRVLVLMKKMGHSLEITAIACLMRILAMLNQFYKPGVKLSELKKFPSFLPEYQHYQFQIHGEGHTHQPLQEEPNVNSARPTTYVNFGTWRDQIVSRKKNGYRRRGVLRAFFILDLENYLTFDNHKPRAFDYFVEDVVHWGDYKDAMDQSRYTEPKF